MGVYGCMINIDTLNITQEILGYIAQIDEFKGSWRALGSLAPERLSALRHIATIESISSSTRIEGSKLSDREVEKLLSNVQINTLHTRDEQEVAGYSEVMSLLFTSWDLIDLTENHIKQLHRDLLKFSDKDTHHRGVYKTTPNKIDAFDASGREIGVIFETASPFETPMRMAEIVTWTNRMFEEKTLHPLLTIAIFTVVFLEIHPFQDGDGRLSRILTSLLLLQTGYSYTTYSSLERIIEQSKESYYHTLRQTQSTIRTEKPNWQPWITYFL